MDFITYTSYEIVALLKGLLAMKYINEALLSGNILTPILWFFLFLSLFRIGMDWIGKKDYVGTAKHIFFFALFIFFVSASAVFNVYNLNLVKYFVDDNISSFWEGIDVRRDMINSKVSVSDVPMMASLLAFSDTLAYEFSNTLFTADSKNVKKDMIGMKIRTNPSFLLDLAYLDFIQADSTNEAFSRIYESSYCWGIKEYILREYPEEKEVVDMIYSKTGLLAKISDLTLLNWLGVGKCTNYTKEYAHSIRKMTVRYITGTDDGSVLLRKYFYKLADNIESNKMIPVQLKESIARNLIATKNITANTLNLIKSGHLDNNWHGFKEAIQNLYSTVKYAVATTVADKYYNELFMYKIQQIVEFLFLALFPLILAMAFLPAFGYNFKLLFSAMFTFFLIKLWIPIYYLAHQLLYNHLLSTMNIYISKGINILIGTAYAGSPLDTSILINTVMPETEHFNDLILNTLAMIIPTALGGGSLFFFGREFLTASMRSASESMGLFRSATSILTRGISKGIGPTKIKRENSSTSSESSGNNVYLSETLKGGGTKTTKFTQSKGGILVPSETYIGVNDVKAGSRLSSVGFSANKHNLGIKNSAKSKIIIP